MTMKRFVYSDEPPTEDQKVFDAALDVINQAVEKAGIPADTAEVAYCRCGCHIRRAGFSMVHFTACCAGRCERCGFHIAFRPEGGFDRATRLCLACARTPADHAAVSDAP